MIRKKTVAKDTKTQNFDQLLGASGIDVGQLGARFGLTPEQTRSALGALMPAVLGGFHKQVDAGDPSGLADGVNAAEPNTSAGNDILGKSSAPRTLAGRSPTMLQVSQASRARC